MTNVTRAIAGGVKEPQLPSGCVGRPGGGPGSSPLALDYQPPVWPSADRPQQFHIDVTVDDIDVAEPLVLALGARRHEVQPPEGEAWRVCLDPAGHHFCLCWD